MRFYTRLIGGVLLIAGTTIGAGMLALPVSTGVAGFIPSLLLFVIYWAFMTFTALLLLEVNLWIDSPQCNLITMARQTIGVWGEWVSWVVYLFLLYALTTAYLAGSAPILTAYLSCITGLSFPVWTGLIPLLLLFGCIVYHGTRSVDYFNRCMMVGLGVTYFLLIVLLAPEVDVERLWYTSWRDIWLGVSVVATSFGFHIIIPSLTTYLRRDVRQLRLAILIGSGIPLVVYLVWQWIALGILPLDGVHGLREGYVQGANGAQLLVYALHHPWIGAMTAAFAFFAIITSFLGVSLSLQDFLADGFHIKKTMRGKLLLIGLTFGPPFLFMLTDPRAFLTALEYAGAFGVVILLGLLPPWMVWAGRYRHGYVSTYRAPGGKWALVLAISLSIAIVFLEIVHKFGVFLW